MKKTKAFPKTLYVTRQDDGGADDYLLTWESIDGPDDGDVAVYELKTVGEVTSTRRFTERPARNRK